MIISAQCVFNSLQINRASLFFIIIMYIKWQTTMIRVSHRSNSSAQPDLTCSNSVRPRRKLRTALGGERPIWTTSCRILTATDAAVYGVTSLRTAGLRVAVRGGASYLSARSLQVTAGRPPARFPRRTHRITIGLGHDW